MSSAVEFVWTEHYDKRSVCVDWSIFTSASDAVSLMLCLGTPVLAAICDRLVKNYRFCRSGFPDLTMWNPDTLKYKIVEVKGPHDKLSSKQILWLDYFMKINADAEVCHVQVGSREVNKKFND
ncbi:FAN1 [Bugula neritina]|uniref:Fanconi-associated nuclease n=1 Tax=Bugula neritina TaxID=10212 RepID=A0A7J7KFV9_BUGNE|nr:FAN1 [Bugula neritina]